MKTVMLSTAFPFLAVALQFNTAVAQELPNGQADYRSYCASCHGMSGRGDGLMAEVLLKKPANLTVLNRNNGGKFPIDKVIATIDGRFEVAGHGGREMPVWGKVFRGESEASSHEVAAEDRILALAYYIRSLQQP